MIEISCKGKYALAAVVELARYYATTSISIRQIAQAREIPQNYLEQLLVTLKKSGIVRSFRGAHGGYALARHPSEVTVREVLECLEGPIELSADSQLSWFWQDAQRQISAVFDVSLETLAMRDVEMEERPTYSI